MAGADQPNNPDPRPPGAADVGSTRRDQGSWTTKPQDDPLAESSPASAQPPPASSPAPQGAFAGPGAESPGVAFPQNLRDRYRLARVLGKGGFANVYLAHDAVLDQDVAIKILKLDMTGKAEQERFLQEARIGAKLRHPNIVTVLDVIQSGDGLQMIMEYCSGGTLGEWIKRHGPMKSRLAIDVARQVALALGHAHRRDFVHRDIKPANVFFAAEGYVKLGDFGIASYVDLHEHTRTGMIVGTPLYMAPEQANDSRDVDPRADVYSLGLTFYYALTAVSPRVLDLERVPPEFHELIRSATRHDRNHRLVSAEQFIAMLDKIQRALQRGTAATDAPVSLADAPEATIPTPQPVIELSDSAVPSTPSASVAPSVSSAPSAPSATIAPDSRPPATVTATATSTSRSVPVPAWLIGLWSVLAVALVVALVVALFFFIKPMPPMPSMPPILPTPTSTPTPTPTPTPRPTPTPTPRPTPTPTPRPTPTPTPRPTPRPTPTPMPTPMPPVPVTDALRDLRKSPDRFSNPVARAAGLLADAVGNPNAAMADIQRQTAMDALQMGIDRDPQARQDPLAWLLMAATATARGQGPDRFAPALRKAWALNARAERRYDLNVDRLKTALGLTDDQARQWGQAFDEAARQAPARAPAAATTTATSNGASSK